MNTARLITLSLVLSSPVWAAKDTPEPAKNATLMNAETFAGLELRSIGPALMSGRIADIAVHPSDQSTWYVGVGSGGVWKTSNAGTTWASIFDDEASYSIGCVTIDPSNPNTVWVGTGENVGGRHVGFGDGIYRSFDGGQHWENLGLKKSEHIGSIVIDPRDSDVVYVAAQGPLWSAGGDRGVFKTADGGKTWKLILSGGEFTGANEVVMDPANPDHLFASLHQRFRNTAALVNGGPESGIFKSIDAGTTWRQVSNGLPEDDMGKIGLAVSPHNSSTIYATIELAHQKGGFFRSLDGGETWEKRNDYLSGGTGPHYYQEIFVSPHQPGRVYQMDVRLHVTEDAGATFRELNREFKHSDNHALAFDPNDPQYLLVGSDGGIYETWDLGQTWKFVANLPITQFYKVAVDYDTPFYNVYGGTQDVHTQGGPSRTDKMSGITNSDWFITLTGDGHQPAVDPTNPDIVYSQWQRGNFSRYDRKTGEVMYIRPQPGSGEVEERFNWDAPILISPHDPARLYVASRRVWRSDDHGDSWRPISENLTRDEDRLTQPMMGRVQNYEAIWDLRAMSDYHTITALAESPLKEGLLYVGTDDHLIQVTADGGLSWRRFDEFSGVPASSYINDVKADLFDEDTVYVAFDNHKAGDFKPYLLKSTDRGATWSDISGDLPPRHLVWRLVQDHENSKLLFVGTEFGILFTVDGGEHWIKLTGEAPNIPFRDLVIQRRENDLVGASFGRSFYILDDYSPLRRISQAALEEEALLFPVKDAWRYIPRRPFGRGTVGYQGTAFFSAPNPPFGAIFTYYLKHDLQTKKAARVERERELAKTGEDTPYPGWDKLREEEKEAEPAIVFTVRDEQGEVVRIVSGPVASGFHRVAWDLRYPVVEAWKAKIEPFAQAPQGVLAPPGTYSVELAKRIDGLLTPLGDAQKFEVIQLTKTTLPAVDADEATAFLLDVDDLKRAVTAAVSAGAESQKQFDLIGEALSNSAHSTSSTLETELVEFKKRLFVLLEALKNNKGRSYMKEPRIPSLTQRLSVIQAGNRNSTYGPTQGHRKVLDLAREEFAAVQSALHALLEVDLPAFYQRLEAAGVPWTPGRPMP